MSKMKKNSRYILTLMIALSLATTVAFCQTDASHGLAEIDRVQSLRRAAELQPGMPPGPPAAQEHLQASRDTDEPTIKVDVWSSAQLDTDKLSRRFAVAALNAAARLQFTERRIANSIQMGYPLGAFWIQSDFDSIDESLRVAALSATNEADRQAFQQLDSQNQRLRLWADWLIQQNRELRLANYFISPSSLGNDEQFQNTVTCTNFLISMLASGRLAEDNSCL
jgi:hypothetical protein